MGLQDDHLNEWMEKMQAQINQVEDALYSRVHKADLISFDNRLNKLVDELQSVKTVGKGAE